MTTVDAHLKLPAPFRAEVFEVETQVIIFWILRLGFVCRFYDNCATVVLTDLSKGEPQAKTDWHQSLINIIDGGVHAVCNEEVETTGHFAVVGSLAITRSLKIAVLKLALGAPDGRELLKVSLADAVAIRAGVAQVGAAVQEVRRLDSFADSILEKTMPRWEALFADLKIETRSRSDEVELVACFMCLVPPVYSESKTTGKGSGKRRREEKRRLRNRATEGGPKRQTQERNAAVGEILKAFMEEARPVLEQVYGKNPGASSEDIEGPMGRVAIQDK
ncbi:hypothetical protein F5883DRAFT_662567 [Diaporthe sp. PMI_573]|nr:hypothetical protein F5883DRAFT_662567 [Diaporthaceae sp. PMI_573]